MRKSALMLAMTALAIEACKGETGNTDSTAKPRKRGAKRNAQTTPPESHP